MASDLLIYSFRTSLCLAAFYLLYKVLLSGETFHRLNRIVLLTTSILSFILPLAVITVKVYRPIRDSILIEPIEVIANNMADTTANSTTSFPLDSVVLGLLILGALGFAVHNVMSILSVNRLIDRGEKLPFNKKITLVLSRDDLSPLSWMNHILLSRKDYYSDSSLAIIAHESEHIRLHHTVDILIMNILTCLQWFNPTIWLLKRELQALHEYQADEAVLRSGAKMKDYQMLLITKAVGHNSSTVANSLNHSSLKSRIAMMLSEKSSHRRRLRALYVVPLIGLAIVSFAQIKTVYVFNNIADDNFKDIHPTKHISSTAIEHNTVEITINATGGVQLNGKDCSVNELKERLAHIEQASSKVIKIKASPLTKMGIVADIKQQLRESNCLRVSYEIEQSKIVVMSEASLENAAKHQTERQNYAQNHNLLKTFDTVRHF